MQLFVDYRRITNNLLFGFTVLLLLGGCKSPEAETAKPNILMISIDDLNTYLACMGDKNAITPNIDRLASSGVLFTNAHCQAPLCGPSRSSIMTGLRPSTTGIYGHIEDDDLRNAHEKTKESIFLPEYFRNYGYHTMGIGKIFHMHAPTGAFDESGGRAEGFGPKPENPNFFAWDSDETNTDWGAFPDVDSKMPDVESTEWVIERLKRDYDKPFFLAIGFLRPHVPLFVPQKWFDLYNVDSIILPPYLPEDFDDIPEISKRLHEVSMMPSTKWAIENGEWKNAVHAYLACVSFVDHYVGQILKTLEESKYKDNTIVVLWSDHGYRCGEKGAFAKHALWQEATKAPVIIAGKGVNADIRVDQPIELLDLYPTMLELCNLPKNEKLEGISLKPVMDNPETDLDKPAIVTYGWNNHAIVKGDYRYIHYEDGSEELYDHKTDPNEFRNVAQNPDYLDAKKELIKYLPKINNPWVELSRHDVNEYMTNQRLEQINKENK